METSIADARLIDGGPQVAQSAVRIQPTEINEKFNYMAMEITSATFDELLKSGRPFVVDFWAEWCGPCRMIAPMIEELAVEYDGRITVGKCNVAHERELPAKYSIRNIPTLLFFKGG